MSFPLNFPATPAIQKHTLRLVSNNASSDSIFTNQQQIIERAGAYWSYNIVLPPMTLTTAQAWIAFLIQLRGKFGTFYFSDPDGNIINGTPLGSPLAGTLAADRMSLASSGWTASKTGLLMPGDWISFANGEYKRVTAQVNSDGSGAATINFMPAMRTPVTGASAIQTTAAKGIFRMTLNDTEFNSDEMKHYGLSLSFREAF